MISYNLARYYYLNDPMKKLVVKVSIIIHVPTRCITRVRL